MSFEALKKSIDANDADTSSILLADIFLKDPHNFKKALLLSNSLPEPLERDFDDKNLETLIQAFILAGKIVIENSMDIVKYSTEFMQILGAIKSIDKNSKSNSERLMKSEFSEFILSKQLQMFCIFIEDQNRLSQAELEKVHKKSKYITGFEHEVAFIPLNGRDDVKISASDNFEANIEIADTLFRYLYYKSRKTIELNDNFDHDDISPYQISSFEEILKLANQRNMLVNIWGKFKYRDWKLDVRKEGEMDLYYFSPKSKEDYKKEQIAVRRYIYRDHINSQPTNTKDLEKIKMSIEFLYEIAKNIDSDNIISLFSISKNDFLKASKYIEYMLLSYSKSIDDVYLAAKFDGIEISRVFMGFKYIITIAMIYQKAVLKDFDQDNKSHYKKLSPIIDVELLIKHFSKIYDLPIECSEKVINLFIFSSKSVLDVFSQPLIYVGKNKVIFCPSLIMQMNIGRVVEMYMTEWNVNVSNKGTEFEKRLRFILSFCPQIQVNTNKIDFIAFDGREVEFDFIGFFEDHLLLVEFKHLKTPFSDRTKKNCEETIDFGVEQVNRRVKVLLNDWDEVKKRCSFNLPDNPVDENKMIKLLCTNILDFAATVKQDVTIIDSSSLLKFFMSPNVNAISVGGDGVEKKSTKKIWSGESPTVEEFRSYLKKPIAIEPFSDCFKPIWRPIMRTKEDDYNIVSFDHFLEKDPYDKFSFDEVKSEAINKNRVGRNDPCPCKSGKKFKKCCL